MFVAELIPCLRDVFCLFDELAEIALTLSGQSHEPQTEDFLTLSPDDLPGEVDGVVSNPPYTGAQALPASYKRRCNTQFEDGTGGTISAKSPLHTYFLYHSRNS